MLGESIEHEEYGAHSTGELRNYGICAATIIFVIIICTTVILSRVEWVVQCVLYLNSQMFAHSLRRFTNSDYSWQMFLSPLLLCPLFLVRASLALYLLVLHCWPVKRVVLGTLSCWLLFFLLQLWLVRFHPSFLYSTSPFFPTISALTWTRFASLEDGGSAFFRNVESSTTRRRNATEAR